MMKNITKRSRQELCCCSRIEFLAVKGTKIAEILSLEGEKFRNVLYSTDDKNKILLATRKLYNTINRAAEIEVQIYMELSRIKECCDRRDN